MTNIANVAIVSLPVADPDRSIAFFRDKLGFAVRRDAPMGRDGGRWVEIAPPGAQTSLALVTWFDRLRPGTIQGLVLATADVAATHDRLAAAGVSVTDVVPAPWGRF